MTELIMEKREDALLPTDDDGYQAMRRMSEGSLVKVNFSVPRSVRQLRLYHAMIKVVFEHQREPRLYATRDDLRAGINLALGHSHEVRNILTGEIRTIPNSVAFGAMDDIAFREYFEAFKHLVLSQILPKVQSRDLDQAVADMLRIAGPDQIERG